MTTDDQSKELPRTVYETVITFYRSHGYIDVNGDLDPRGRSSRRSRKRLIRNQRATRTTVVAN